MKFKKNIILILSIFISFTIILASTFAWWSTVEVVQNKLEAADTKDVKIYEEFTPPDGWVPGAKVDKLIKVIKTGTGSVVARVKLTEMLELLKLNSSDPSDLAIFYNIDDPVPGTDRIPIKTTKEVIDILSTGYSKVASSSLSTEAQDITGLTVMSKSSGSNTYYFAYYESKDEADNVEYIQVVEINNISEGLDKATFSFPFYEKDTTYSKSNSDYDPTNPNADIDHDVITLQFNEKVYSDLSAWDGAMDAWFYGGDGYYYYGQLLDKNIAETVPLLESLTLSKDASNQYKNMKYQIDVKLEAVQAIQEAVKETWKVGSDNFDVVNAPVWNKLKDLIPTE